MQATKHKKTIKMYSPQYHTNIIQSENTKLQLKKDDNIIETLQCLTPPNDEDSCCFVKSSN
ncbi:hypothetical protein [Colwellia sp. E150_009]